MVSREERDTIQLVHGLGPTKSRPLNLESPRPRFKNPPVEIVPGQTRPRQTVFIPYDKLGITNAANITNRTARQTLISPLNPDSSRLSTSRTSFSRSALSGAALNNKGKDKAVPTSIDSPRKLSPEIIDIDSENPSADELNLLDGTLNIKSQYFTDNSLPGPSKIRKHIPAVRRSLVEDGQSTRQLQYRHEQQEDKAPSSSPIDHFTEDEGDANEPSRQQGLVQSRVANFESMFQQRLPIYDFKNRNRNAKDRMHSKSGPSKRLALPMPRYGPRSGASARKRILPISSVIFGIQELSSYDTMTFAEDTRTISFSGPSVQEISPILLADTMASMEATDPSGKIPPDGRMILHMKSSGASFNAPWQSDYSSVFRPGDSKKGRITVLFNHTHKDWDMEIYKSLLHGLKHIGLDTIRPKASEAIWKAIVKGMKYRDEPLHGASISLLNNTDEKNGPDHTPNSMKRSKKQKSPVINPSTHRQRVTDSVALLGRPMAEEAVRSHKRPFDHGLENQDSSEVASTDPAPKRQRLEDPQPLRRSTRNSAHRNDVPKVDQDEVILVYPYGVPGAVNITVADLNRLQPDEFLNDTLIEFGLKSWLKEFEIIYPEVAAQVHVFNSFFYKKLNKRKEGYESVRKWTSKIDIFSKKYIIVPINEKFHWYLALIYEPEHILQTPAVNFQTPTPFTRRQARESHISVSSPIDQRFNIQEGTVDVQDNGTNSENEVEQLAIHASCSITITSNDQSTSSAEEVKEDLVGESNHWADQNRKYGSPMDLDGIGENPPIEISDNMEIIESDGETVTPSRYLLKRYTNPSKQRKQLLEGKPSTVGRESSESDIDPLRTKIFIMDSLGTKHGQAMKQLSKWLEYEAMDKRGIEKITPPITKMAPVPVQPNFCDCGLYLLHFAATFMKKPPHFCNLIMNKERPSLAERQADWEDASVATMREDLRAKILRFSDEWREQRAEREEKEKLKAEDEDSDVAIVEHVRSSKRDKSTKSYRTKS